MYSFVSIFYIMLGENERQELQIVNSSKKDSLEKKKNQKKMSASRACVTLTPLRPPRAPHPC